VFKRRNRARGARAIWIVLGVVFLLLLGSAAILQFRDWPPPTRSVETIIEDVSIKP